MPTEKKSARNRKHKTSGSAPQTIKKYKCIKSRANLQGYDLWGAFGESKLQ